MTILRNKVLYRVIGIVLLLSLLLSHTSVFAFTSVGNIGPQISALSLSKQRKVTIQIDQGNYGQSMATVQSRINSVLVHKLESEKIEVDVRLRSISTIDTVVNSTAFSDDSENFYVSLHTGSYPEFSDPAKSANILNLFIEKQVTFVGLGTASNKAAVETFISKNQSNGTFIDNSNLDSALSRLADYILGRTSISLDLYVGEGKYQDDKALIQTKINEILKAKLIPANIDADINIKMFKKVQKNPRLSNLYFIDNFGDKIYEYSVSENKFNVLYTDTSNSIPWSYASDIRVGFDGNLYFTTETESILNKKLYKFNIDTKQMSLCVPELTCYAVSNNGKVYWAKSISSPKWHSEIYEYNPITNTNTLIANTKVGSGWIYGSGMRVEQLAVSNDNKLFMAINDTTGNVNPTSLYGYDLVTRSFLTNGRDPSTTMYAEKLAECVYPQTKLIITADSMLVLTKQIVGYSGIAGIVAYNVTLNGIAGGNTVAYSYSDLRGGANQTVYYYDTNNGRYLIYDIINGSPVNKGYNYSASGVVVSSDGTSYYENTMYLEKLDGTRIDLPVRYHCFAKYPPIDMPLITYDSLDTTLQNKVFDTSKDSFVAYLGDTNLADLSDSTKRTSIVNKLKSGAAKFIGLGSSTNQVQLQNVVSLNNNQGAYYDNGNIDAALNNLADYIIANTHLPDRTFQNYIVVSEDSTNIEVQEGSLDTNGLPSYSTSYVRSMDYNDVTGGSSYSFSASAAVNDFNLYWYTSTLQFIRKDSYTEPPTNLISPLNASYVKIVYPKSHNAVITLINNTESSGENISYSATASDSENDNLEYVYKYNHDPLKINGVNIDNPSDKIALNNTAISIPIKRFTKPGTYQISMYAKDVPKQISDTYNLITNGGAESTNPDGSISDWYSWAANPGITYFTRRTTSDWKISGTGTFEICTASRSDGTANATYYHDVDVISNTEYKLTGLLSSHRCQAYFVVYEMNDKYDILKSYGSASVDNNPVPQSVTMDFKTDSHTTKLRIHIVKSNTINPIAGYNDYVFADDLKLAKMVPNPDFNEYRKTSSTISATLYAHRLPKAQFTYQIENPGGTFKIKNLADNNLSYDPDHSSRSDKGIIDRQWKWAEVAPDGNVAWHDGKVPDTQEFAPGSQVLLWYRVRDIDGPGGKGAWSKPKMQRIDGQVVSPISAFTAIPNPVPKQTLLDMFDQSYSRNYGGYITSRSWTLQKVGATVQPLVPDYADYTNNKFSKWFGSSSYGFGKYIITLTVSDSFGLTSQPYSQTVEVIDTINPTASVNPASGAFNGDGGAVVNIIGNDTTLSTSYNRGLKTIQYAWSKNSSAPLSLDTVHTVSVSTEGTFTKAVTTAQTAEGTWYLYVKDEDYAGNTNNAEGSYTRYGPYIVETLKASNFLITMMLDVGWRSYYFDVNNGIDDNHDGETDRYPRRSNTDIGTLKLPINYFNLVGHDRTYIKAGYKVKGKIDIVGDPDWAAFDIHYIRNGSTYTNRVMLTRTSGDIYTFDWIIPLETDDKTFVSFDLVTKKGSTTYGNEKWTDTWDARNTSRLVFYIRGKATDDLIYVQSQ